MISLTALVMNKMLILAYRESAFYDGGHRLRGRVPWAR